MRFLLLIDPLQRLDLRGDSSFALMLEMGRREHEIYTCQPEHLHILDGVVIADACKTVVHDAATPELAFHTSPATAMPLSEIDAVLIRQDPPVDANYLQTTWLLDRARNQTLLVNDPRGLREFNEHLAILDYPEFIPRTLVTRDVARLRQFLADEGGTMIVKPIDGFGGRGIFKCVAGDTNLGALLESATEGGLAWTMAQSYLPAAVAGDKRIVLVDGDPIGAILRVPPAGENRGNLHVGGTAQAAHVTAREQQIIAALKPRLREYGLLLVGIDVIGEYLTEVNVTSPTGLRHLDQLNGGNSAAPVLDCIERKIRA